MTFATGYKPDPDGYRRTPFHHMKARLGVTALPLLVSLLAFVPAMLDQNRTGSCTGGSTGAACTCDLAANGTPLGFVASPRGIYDNGRAIDRVPNEDGSLPPLTDDGAEPNAVMRGISEWGVRPMKGPTSAGENYDCEPANVNDEPALGELEEEATRLLLGEYGITSTGKQRVVDMQTALAGKKPICCAIAGGSDTFQGYSGGVMGPIGTALDHYVWLYGYEVLPDGSVVFFGRNQWGTSWGEQGRDPSGQPTGESGNFRINEAGVAELGDIVVLDVKVMP